MSPQNSHILLINEHWPPRIKMARQYASKLHLTYIYKQLSWTVPHTKYQLSLKVVLYSVKWAQLWSFDYQKIDLHSSSEKLTKKTPCWQIRFSVVVHLQTTLITASSENVPIPNLPLIGENISIYSNKTF